MLEAETIARHVDNALLKKLEIRRFGDGKKKPRGKKVPAGQSYTTNVEEEEVDSDEVDEVSEEEELEESNEAEEDNQDQDVEQLPELPEPTPGPSRSRVGTYVAASYEESWFLAEICADQKGVGRGYTRLSYMLIRGRNSFAWGDRKDIHVALDEDIILEPVLPEPVNSRGNLGLKKNDLQRVESWMVVVYLSCLSTSFRLQ